ncbi:hypothetical protein BGZ65_004642, partial [Modicella reniformis]
MLISATRGSRLLSCKHPAGGYIRKMLVTNVGTLVLEFIKDLQSKDLGNLKKAACWRARLGTC